MNNNKNFGRYALHDFMPEMKQYGSISFSFFTESMELHGLNIMPNFAYTINFELTF